MPGSPKGVLVLELDRDPGSRALPVCLDHAKIYSVFPLAQSDLVTVNLGGMTKRRTERGRHPWASFPWKKVEDRGELFQIKSQRHQLHSSGNANFHTAQPAASNMLTTVFLLSP